MRCNWMAGLAAGIMVLFAAGCVREVIPPSEVVPDAAPLQAKISQALVKAGNNQKTMQSWDVYLPYIELVDYPETGAGIWFVAIVDQFGEYIWNYSSELEQYKVNPRQVAGRLERELQAALPKLVAGESVWGEVLEQDGYRAVFYYVPIPAEAQVQREGAPHPQYMALLLVEQLPQD